MTNDALRIEAVADRLAVMLQGWTGSTADTRDELVAELRDIAAIRALSAGRPKFDVDALAQEIRRVDGGHSLGAGALAEALAPYIAALSPPALDAPVVGDAVKRAIHSADLYGVLMDVQNRIDSPGLPSMANNAIRLIDSAREAYASPVAAQAVTDAMVERACFAYHKAHDFMGPPPRADRMREALTAALAHPNAAPCDAQGASNGR